MQPAGSRPHYPRVDTKSDVLNDLIRACALSHSVHGSAPPPDTTQRSLYITLNTNKAHLAALTTKFEAKYDWEKRLHPESALFLAIPPQCRFDAPLPACIHTHKFNLVQYAVATRYRERWRRTQCQLSLPAHRSPRLSR